MLSDFGFSELILIVAIGVLLIAPKELPHVLKNLYKGYYKIISFKSNVEMKIEEETEEMLGNDFLSKIQQETYEVKSTISNSLEIEKEKIRKRNL